VKVVNIRVSKLINGLLQTLDCNMEIVLNTKPVKKMDLTSGEYGGLLCTLKRVSKSGKP